MIPFAVDPQKDTICDVIRRWADIQPDAAALVAEDQQTLTYGEFSNLMEDIRKSINRVGFGRGNRIAIIHSGGPDLVTTIFGVASGATAVPLNPRYTAAEFTGHLQDRAVDLVLIEKGLESDINTAVAGLGMPHLEIEKGEPATLGHVTIDPDDFLTSARPPERAQAEDMVFVLATSGTTSRSKVVPYRHRHLVYRAMAHAELFQLTEDDRCLNVRPLHYGSQPLLAAVFLTGGSLALMPGLAARRSIDGIDRLSPTWVSGGFTYYQSIYDPHLLPRRRSDKSRIRFLSVGSGRLPDDVADGLERIFGLPVIEGYASTEMSRISGNPLPPGTRKRGTVGKPVGCEVRIRSLDGEFMPAGLRGEVVVKGPQGIEGYENDPEANAEAFIDGWFRTGDEGFFDEDGYLTLTGRIKEMINRGGEKVSPAEVDAAAMNHRDVEEAATFPIPHPTLGEEVAIAVVRRNGSTLRERDLTAFFLDRLAGFKVPRKAIFVDEIPKSDGGKVQRYRLAEHLGVTSDAESVPPGEFGRKPTPMEFRLQHIWRDVLKLRDVGLNDNFFLLGGDSLQAVDLFLQIEKELKCRLPVAALFEAGTIAEMARLIEDEKPQGCIVAIQPEGTRPPFFCVHGASGQVIGFYGLSNHLGQDQPFYGIQSIGWDRTAPPFTRSRDMVAYYVKEMRKVQPHGPYYLGGYSFGGRIAVHMAELLKQAGEEVQLLAIIDSTIAGGRRYVGYKQWIERIGAPPGLGRVGLAVRYGWFRLRKAYDEAYDRSRRIGVFGVRELYRAMRWKVPLALCRPDRLNALIRFEHRKMPLYEGDAVYFRTEIPTRSMAHPDTKDAWKQTIKGTLKTVTLPGEHGQVIQEPNVRYLAEVLDRCLASAMGRERAPQRNDALVAAAASEN